jgi:hypothetical protein
MRCAVALLAAVVFIPSAAAEDLLPSVERENRLIAAQVRAEVESTLRAAAARMADDPAAVEQELKLLRERVRHVPQLSDSLRRQLARQIETATSQAYRLARTKEVVDAQLAAERAAAADRQQVARSLDRDQQRLKQLLDRFDSLVDEGRFAAAEGASAAAAEVAPDAPIVQSADLAAKQVNAARQITTLRRARQAGVVATLAAVETSHLPFADDQPVVYPDAETWRQLSDRRRATLVDLRNEPQAEAKIRQELREPTTLEFIETPLDDVVAYLKDLHGIEIQIDRRELEAAGLSGDIAITGNFKGITLRSALRIMLSQYELSYVVRDEVLMITTATAASQQIVTRLYPVADIVTPLRATTGTGTSAISPMNPAQAPNAMPPGPPGMNPGNFNPGFGNGPLGNGPAM